MSLGDAGIERERTPTGGLRRRRRAVPLAMLAVVAMALVTVPGARSLPAAAQQTDLSGGMEVMRYAGENRYDTARRIATEQGVGAPNFGGDTALVARADTFPDSLAGSYLAGVLDAPVLLTHPDRMIEPFERALAEFDASNLVLLGGEAAISQQVEDTLAEDHNVVRVAGADRYETAAEIARHSSGSGEHEGLALLSSGEDFPDALTAGAVAAGEEIPLLLTAQAGLPPSTTDALQDLGIDEVIVTGGTAAVSEGVAQQVRDLGVQVTRVAGANRFATARAIGDLATRRFGWRTDHVNVTNGLRFPDAVALAAHAGLEAGGPAPIALSANSLPGPTEQWLSELAGCDFARMDIAGGPAAVPDEVETAASNALRPGECADDAAPEVSFSAPEDGATVRREQDGVELRGTASDDTTGVRKVEIFVNGRQVAATTGDRSTRNPREWAVTVTPEAKSYTFEAVAIDGAGRTGRATLTVTVEGRDPAATIVDNDAQVLGDDVVDYNPDSGRIVLGNQPSDEPVEAGDTVVSGTSPAAPEGFLRTVVTARANDDGQVVLETVIGHLTDVFRQVDTRLHTPVDLSGNTDTDPSDGVTLTPSEDLPPADITLQDVDEGPRSDFPPPWDDSPATTSSASASRLSASAPARKFLSESIGKTWTLDFDKTIGGGDDTPSLTVEGHNKFHIGVTFQLKIETDWNIFNADPLVQLKRFRLVGEMTDNVRVAAVAQADFDRTETVSLWPIHDLGAINFQVGPVPVTLVPSLEFNLELNAEVGGKATASAEGHLELVAGTKFEQGNGFEPVSRFERSWETEPLTFDGHAQAKAGLKGELTVALWDTAGTAIEAGPYIKVEANANEQSLWALLAGLEGDVKFVAQIPVIKKGVESPKLPLFEAKEQQIATASDFPDHTPNEPDETSTEPEPPAVRITSPSQDSVGCCEVLLRADTHSPRHDRGLSVDYRSDQDGDLGSGFGEEPVRATLSPGTHTLTAEVSEFVDGEELTATEQISVEVEASRRRTEQFFVSGTLGAAGDPLAGLLGMILKNDEDVFFDDAEFLSAPPTGGFAGTVDNPPGGFDEQAVILSTGDADDADTANEADEDGTDLGGGAVRGDSDRDVTVWALHMSVPEHANCLTFDHRFLSEEVPRFVGSEYNDAFVAEVFDRDQLETGVPGSDWSVSGSELSAPESFAFGPGEFHTQVNASPQGVYVTPSNAFQTTYQSGHPRMRAATPVTPGADQSLVLSLFDQGDARYDSAVILDNLRLLQVPDAEADCTGGVAPGGLSLTTAPDFP